MILRTTQPPKTGESIAHGFSFFRPPATSGRFLNRPSHQNDGKKNEFRGGFFCRHRSKMFFPPTLNTEGSDRSPRAYHVTSTLKRIKQTNVNTLRIPTANQTRCDVRHTRIERATHNSAMHAASCLPHTCVPPFDTPQPFRNLPPQNTPEQRGKYGGECAPALDTRARKSGICEKIPHHPRWRIVLT